MIKGRFWSGTFITELKDNEIFVYGANPEFRNGAGGAKAARKFGAPAYGAGRGIVGQTFGIITKNLKAGYVEEETGIVYEKSGFRSVSPEMISKNIDELYNVALDNPDKNFLITYKADKDNNGRLKKSLNGYDALEIWKMFSEGKVIPENIIFHDSYKMFFNLKEKDKKEIDKKEIEYPKPSGESYAFFGKEDPFSIDYPSPFCAKDRHFSSHLHFVMYSKAFLLGDKERAEAIKGYNNFPILKNLISGKTNAQAILNSTTLLNEWGMVQGLIFQMGNEVKDAVGIWPSRLETILLTGFKLKLQQNPDILDKLKLTESNNFIYAAPYDKVFGIGASGHDVYNKDRWTGDNYLGKTINLFKLNYL